jgi:hypothetical protein
MYRLSDPATRDTKVLIASLTSTLTLIVVIWSFFGGRDQSSPVISLVVAIFVAAIMVGVLRRRCWYIADDVSHDGTFIVARRGKREARIAIGDIADVYPVNALSREGIEIVLRTPTPPFGGRVVFMPPQWKTLKRQDMDQVAEEIKVRLGIARAT